MHRHTLFRTTTALAFVAAFATASTTSIAAPLNASHAVATQQAIHSDVVQVGRRHHYYGAAALGVFGGLALAGALYAPHYYAYHYPQPYVAYSAPYPYYYAPRPARQCWVQTGPYRGQGYSTYC